MKLVKEHLNEITPAENRWADEEIDKYLESKQDKDLDTYINKAVDYIWDKLVNIFNTHNLKLMGIDKEYIDDMITTYDKSHGFYMSIYDYYEEGTPSLKASELLFDLCYKNISTQGENI